MIKCVYETCLYCIRGILTSVWIVVNDYAVYTMSRCGWASLGVGGGYLCIMGLLSGGEVGGNTVQ